MKMIIVAGGQGTRLRPLTNDIPKPMVDVQGKPILEHILLHARQYGISEFIFALCYLPNIIVDYFDNGKKWNVTIDYIFEDEEKPLGSAGAILESKRYITDTFIVTYADILRDLTIEKMINAHKQNNAETTINVYKRFGPDPKSMVKFDKEGRVTDFIERPTDKEINDDFVWSNGSFYIFEPSIFEYIKKDEATDFGKDIFPQLLKDDKTIYAFPSEGYFIDIGTLEKLERARETYRSL